MKSIIIRTPNFIGDTINTTPCLELVKQEYPDARITLVGPDFIRDMFSLDARITDFITFPLRKRKKFATSWLLWKEIRKRKGDLGIIFVNTFISALLFKLSGIKCNIGYKNEGRGFLLDFKPGLNRNIHYINRYANLFNRFVGDKYVTLPELQLPVTGQQTYSFANTQKTIGLYLGGTNKGFRSYPDEYAVLLIRLLHGRHYNIVLIGDQNDGLKHQQYANAAQVDNLIDLSGKTDIKGFFNTIASLDVLITIDSAALHVAAAVKTKFIGLMGLSTSPTSTVTPKVSFGKILKVENNLIREEDYIKNITPGMIMDALHQLAE